MNSEHSWKLFMILAKLKLRGEYVPMYRCKYYNSRWSKK